jgi:phosphoglycolate phosphatase
MVELTARLKTAGFRLAIATCKPWAYCGPTLAQCGFLDCFEAVSGSYHKRGPRGEGGGHPGGPAPPGCSRGDRADDRRPGGRCAWARTWGIPCLGVEFCGYADPGELAGAGAVAVVRTAGELERFLTVRADGNSEMR